MYPALKHLNILNVLNIQILTYLKGIISNNLIIVVDCSSPLFNNGWLSNQQKAKGSKTTTTKTLDRKIYLETKEIRKQNI